MISAVLAATVFINAMRADMAAIAPPACHAIREAKYGAQIYDLVNTQRVWANNPREQEVDISRALGKRSILGVIVGQVVLDVVADALTRRSPALRCAADARQLMTNLGTIIFTNTHESP